MTEERIAVYPGSFDPVTYGHLDLVERALQVFDRVIVAVARNVDKRGLFSVEERIALFRAAVGDNPRIGIETFDGLLVDFVTGRGATAILRGLRAVSDFEYELQIAQMNRTLNREVETLFMMTAVPYGYLSSSLVKEVASLHGPVDALVPAVVRKALEKKFSRG